MEEDRDVLILAHRGAHHPETPGVPENTVAAFQAALGLGIDGVELDVRRAGDGVLVVHHDPALPDGRPISGTAAAALPPSVPTLSAALSACASLTLVDVEIKASPLEPGYDSSHIVALEVAHLLAQADGRPPAETLVSSFDLGTLDAFRAAAPAVATGWLTLPGYDQLAAAATAAAGGHAALNPPDGATTAEVVDAVHAAGLQAVVWTVDDPARMEQLAAAGVDVLITNRPGLAVSILH